MEKNLLVIIVTYNGIKWIDKCLSSIASSSVKASVFIVDNGSTDGTQKYIADNYPEVIFMQSAENLGFGRANNIGLQYAADENYEYVYLLNQDAWVEEDTFKTLIEANRNNPEYGILSPIQMQANGKKMDINFLNYVAYRTKNGSMLEDIYSGNTKDIYEVGDVMAAHWLISRRCLRETGGFSPAFRHYGEDDNYIDRAAYHGFKTGIVPESRAVHDRESRKATRKSLAYRCGTMILIELSQISKKINWFKPLLKCLQYTYNYGIFRQYGYLIGHFVNIGKIMRIRRQSRSKGAFLEIR